ncbi:MAG TPA: NADH-ubiquinone oxidoreductase-F iron-sulfur binding region domain-containing protein [Acidimicrobiales bacterium]|nr:NADH-ubiquinone oxidoreductase-F iron-sulfur binding region domain-containing protein [Acidimicrobiales bacterium]
MVTFLLPAEPITSVEGWMQIGGGEALALAVELGPERTIEELRASGLRGRGGGGFPTGRKWSGVRSSGGTHRYVVANGAEGEPATFKDRAILRANPYQVVEGLAIAAATLGATEAFIGLKASFEPELAAVTRAVSEMQAAGMAGDVPITIVRGPDEYLYGEETALLEVIEGHAPLPRLFRPFEHGLFATAPQSGWESHEPEAGHKHHGAEASNPTLVNNVETLANVPHILARGAKWFRSMGTEQSPGNVVATVVGDVVAPDYGEVELGTPLGDVIDAVGSGLREGRRVKAVFSGVANAVITASDLVTPVSYETMAAIGSGMGAAGFAVYDETACMVDVAREFSRFLYVESCGQCPACKFGTGEITAHLSEIAECRATDEVLDIIAARLKSVTDANRCYLPVEERLVVASILRSFPEEFATHLEGYCPRPRSDLVVPIIKDLGGGRVTYDERHRSKLPDWTYASG